MNKKQPLVREVMSTQLVCVSPETTALAVSQLMAKRDIGSVLIKSGEQIVGIITEKDLIRKVLAAEVKAGEVKAEALMSSPVASVDQEISLEEAHRMMGEQNIRHLMVTAKGKPVGVISVRSWLGG